MTLIHGFCIQNYVNFQYKTMELIVSEKLFVPLNVYRHLQLSRLWVASGPLGDAKF